MKKIIIPILLTLLLLMGGAYWVGNQNKDTSESVKQEDVSAIQTTIIVDDGVSRDELTVSSKEVKTAFQLLQKYSEEKGVEIVSKQYDFGVLVESIGNKKNTPSLAWIYYINDKSASVGASEYQLQNGDIILWKYEKPQF